MYKLYNVTKDKSKIIGFWRDNRKIYKDNINLLSCKDTKVLNDKISILFAKGEKAIFYTFNNMAFVKNARETEILNNRIYKIYKRLKPSIVKKLILKYNGLTVYRIKRQYAIEIYTKG